MPTPIASKVSDHILAQLQAALPAYPAGSQQPVFLLDGSSLELEHTAELAAAYPPAENQYGKAHWPTLRIAVAHNLANGLASRPSWGAMYGTHAVSEQALAEDLMDRLPQGAVVVGRPQLRRVFDCACGHGKGTWSIVAAHWRSI